MDDVTSQRFKDLEGQISQLKQEVGLRFDAVESNVADLQKEVTTFRTEVHDAFRNLDLRVTTEIRETAGLIRDLKTWLIERDDTRTRIAKLEEEMAQLKNQLASPPF